MLDPRLLFVAVVWAVNFSVVKYALTDFSPLSFTVVRFALSSLFLILVMAATREPFTVQRRHVFPIIWLGFIGIAMYNLLFMYGLKYTTASNSALFISMSPVFAAVILALIQKRGISMQAGAGLILSTIGVFLIIQSTPGKGLTFSREALAGDLLTICAAVFWALYTILAKPLVEHYAPVKVTAYSMAIGTLILLPLGADQILNESWSSIPIKSWAAFSFSTFISGGVAFTLWYQGVKRIGITRTVVYHNLVPFIAVLFAALFLGERITILQVAGGCLVLFGVYLVQKSTG